MSDIHGTGFGSSHDWRAGYTGPNKGTPYACANCGVKFIHWYDETPNIFKAIEQSGCVDQCTSPNTKANETTSGQEKK